MNQKYTVAINRSSEDETGVVISFELNQESALRESVVLRSFQKAIHEWIVNTPQGKCCFEYAETDLNIGDIVTFADETLNPYLEKEGILNFRVVDQPIRFSNWVYDTLLHPEELEEN